MYVSYDGRGLLTYESHPEKGSFGYGSTNYAKYDAGGNVRRRTDGLSTGMYDLEMTYDAAGRLLTVQDRNPSTGARRLLKECVYATANACVAGVCDSRNGKLWKATRHNHLANLGNVTVEETYTYTGLGGRPKKRDTVVAGTASFTGASFALDQSWTTLGQLESVTYPTTTAVSQPRTVWYGYTNGLLTSVDGYVSSITYHPNRVTADISHTNGVTETWLLDLRLPRPLQIRVTGPNLSDWTYGNYAYDAAGNITAIGNSTYSYDPLGRLTGWTEKDGVTSFVTVRRTYDSFGNYDEGSMQGCTMSPGRAFPTCHTTSFKPLDPDSSTNHYPFETYDAAGSVTSDASHSYGYDGSGTMISLTGSGRDLRYVYTADDERIAIVDRTAGTTTWTLRDTSNRLLRTYTRTTLTGTFGWSWTEDEIWRGSLLLANETPSGRKHHHLDHLGSPRLITASNGTRLGEQRFTPFGTGGSVDGGRIQFTGHETDRVGNREGLIYAHARYLEGGRGRFLSVDPVLDVKRALRSPQMWNRYTYVENNPINAVDPDGRQSASMHAWALAKSDQHLYEQGEITRGELVQRSDMRLMLAEITTTVMGMGGLVKSAASGTFSMMRAGFSAGERGVIRSAANILKTGGKDLVNAFRSGQAKELTIAGQKIIVQPDAPISGMTLHGEKAFVLGREAFKSNTELAKTVLHEMYRLTFQQGASASGASAAASTKAAAAFAEAAFNAFKFF